MKQTDIDDYMFVSEAAERWGMSVETVKNRLKHPAYQADVAEMLDKGMLKKWETSAGRGNWIIHKSAMERWFKRKEGEKS